MHKDQEDLAARLAMLETAVAALGDRVEHVACGAEVSTKAAPSGAQDVIADLRKNCDDMAGQLSVLRQAFRVIELRLRKVEAAVRGSGATTVPTKPTAGTRPPTPATAKPASAPPPSPAAHPPTGNGPPSQPPSALTVVHFDEHETLRAIVQSVAQKWSARYLSAPPPGAAPRGLAEHRLLALNLLSPNEDPLRIVSDPTRWGLTERRAFTYCGDGSRGVVLGLVEYFPPPFDPSACVARVLQSDQSPERILLVSENFDLVNPIRAAFTDAHCTVSVAFDARQGLDLIPMIKPQLVLVDFRLPRGEGLRMAARLRRLDFGKRTALGFFWNETLDPEDLRNTVMRAVRDLPFSADELSRGLSRALAPSR